MKPIIIILFFFCSLPIFAQDAEIMLVNTESLPINLTIKDAVTDSILVDTEFIEKLQTITQIAVPANTILDLSMTRDYGYTTSTHTVEDIILEEGLTIVCEYNRGFFADFNFFTIPETSLIPGTIQGYFQHLSQANLGNIDTPLEIDLELENESLFDESMFYKDFSPLFSFSPTSNPITLRIRSNNANNSIIDYDWNIENLDTGKWVYVFTDFIFNVFLVDIANGTVIQLPKSWVTSIPEIANNPINLFPNPSNDFIEIEMNDFEQSTYKIYSIDGQLIEESAKWIENKISVKHLPKGDYLIQLEKDGSTFVKQFSKY